MYILRLFAYCLLVFFVSYCNICFAQSDSQKNWPYQLRFLSGEDGGQRFTAGINISKVLTREIIPTYNRLGGGVSNLTLINQNKGDIGFASSCFIELTNSNPEYSSLKADNITIVAKVAPQVLYFLIHKEFAEKHNIYNVSSLLKSQYPIRFTSLKPGSSSEFLLSLLFKYGYNTNFKQLKKQGWHISFSTFKTLADDFSEGNIDAFAYAGGPTVPVIKTFDQFLDVIILPIEQPILDKLAHKFKTKTSIIHPGMYKNVKEPITTLSDDTILIAHKSLPDNLIYSINDVLMKNKKEIAEKVAGFNAFCLDSDLPNGYKIHPGSVQFWNDHENQQP